MKKCIITSIIYSALMLILGMMLNIETGFNPQLNPRFIDLFGNNIKVEFMCIVFSIISVGIYSLVYLTNNFIFLGLLIKNLIQGQSVGTAIVYIVPHGVFEIPVMIVTASIGLYIPIYLIKVFCKKRKVNKEEVKKFIFKWTSVVIVLTIIAAAIETYVTPNIIRALR